MGWSSPALPPCHCPRSVTSPSTWPTEWASSQQRFPRRASAEAMTRTIPGWSSTGRVAVSWSSSPGSARFELSREEVVLLADESGDPDLVTHLLLDHVLPRVVALRGDLMLHGAGAVGPSGRAHLLLGPTGTGKSTLVTALAAGGWALLDDDGIRVLNVEGVPHAVPGYAGVRLLPDAAEAVLPGVVRGRPMARGHAKRRFAVDGLALRMADGPAPIAGLYVLERTANERPSVDRMGFGEAVGASPSTGSIWRMSRQRSPERPSSGPRRSPRPFPSGACGVPMGSNTSIGRWRSWLSSMPDRRVISRTVPPAACRARRRRRPVPSAPHGYPPRPPARRATRGSGRRGGLSRSGGR